MLGSASSAGSGSSSSPPGPAARLRSLLGRAGVELATRFQEVAEYLTDLTALHDAGPQGEDLVHEGEGEDLVAQDEGRGNPVHAVRARPQAVRSPGSSEKPVRD